MAIYCSFSILVVSSTKCQHFEDNVSIDDIKPNNPLYYPREPRDIKVKRDSHPLKPA